MTSSSSSSTDGDPLKDDVGRRLATEWAGFGARERSAEARKYREAQGELWSAVTAVGRTGSIDTILTAERTILDNELLRYGNSAEMRRSINTGLAELAGAEHHLEIVRSPDRYRSLDVAFQRPRHRRQGLPDEEARQFFRAHNARLLNQDRARLSNEEKRTLEARCSNPAHRGESLHRVAARRAGVPRKGAGPEPGTRALIANNALESGART